MPAELVYRGLFTLSGIIMLVIRIYYQSKVLHTKEKIELREGWASLAAGAVAALTTIVFGLEYIIYPGVFGFAYTWVYPDWLRWLGAGCLLVGIGLLWLAHHHLGKSFYSLIVAKEKHQFVQSGPYALIRHPIYAAYLLNYLGGGLLASNLVLTFIPLPCFALLVWLRMGKEEAVMIDQFGQTYRDYMDRTGRLVPKIPLRFLGD